MPENDKSYVININGYVATTLDDQTYYFSQANIEFSVNDNVILSVTGQSVLRASIEELYISNSVTAIPNDAFKNCTEMTSVTIGNSVLTIGAKAFGYCNELISVTMSDSILIIGDFAFYDSMSLNSINIPDSVIMLDNSSFGDIDNLTSVIIGNSVTNIGAYSFNGCNGLTSVTMGNSVTRIGTRAFGNCNLDSVTIPSNVTSISNNTFNNCNNLTNVYISQTTADALSIVSTDTDFYGADNITITIYNIIGMTVTGDIYYLYDMNESVDKNDIIEIEILQGTTDINDIPFSDYTYLKKLSIPSTVTTISDTTFNNCNNLTNVYISQTTADALNIVSTDTDFYGADNITITIYLCIVTTTNNSSSYLSKQDIDNLIVDNPIVEIEILQGTTDISAIPFSDYTYLKTVFIPDSVTSISDSTFVDCTGVDVIITDSNDDFDIPDNFGGTDITITTCVSSPFIIRLINVDLGYVWDVNRHFKIKDNNGEVTMDKIDITNRSNDSIDYIGQGFTTVGTYEYKMFGFSTDGEYQFEFNSTNSDKVLGPFFQLIIDNKTFGPFDHNSYFKLEVSNNTYTINYDEYSDY